MKTKLAVAVISFVGASSIFTSVAFAGSTTQPTTPTFSTKVTTPTNADYITLSIPNLNQQLQPAQTLQFVFTLGAPYNSNYTQGTDVKETGTLQDPSSFTYKIPLPNYGSTKNVWVYTAYTSNVNGQTKSYTATAGPLLDTLPEAPLAALIPLGMVGIWYVNRKRKMKKSLIVNA